MCHASTLPDAVAEVLLDEFGPDGLPRYGPTATRRRSSRRGPGITVGLEASTRTFAWQGRGVMVVNDVLSTHGREPFTGECWILVDLAGVGGVGV